MCRAYDCACQWSKIRENSQWIVQFHSTDDPFIPPEEARHVAKSLKLQLCRPENDGEGRTTTDLSSSASADAYYEYTNRSHFFREFDELITVVGMKLGHL